MKIQTLYEIYQEHGHKFPFRARWWNKESKFHGKIGVFTSIRTDKIAKEEKKQTGKILFLSEKTPWLKGEGRVLSDVSKGIGWVFVGLGDLSPAEEFKEFIKKLS